MRKREGKLVFAPTDLAGFLKSPYATWMDRLALEEPEAPAKDEADEYLDILATKGYEHEEAVENRLRANGFEVTSIADDQDATAATREALARGDEVIVQGRLEAPPFAGVSDFLMRVEAGAEGATYEVWDAKLARSARPAFLVQLCAYAEMVEATTGMRPPHVGLFLGDGSEMRFRTDDFYFHYLRLKAAFLEQMASFDPACRPLPQSGVDHGHWASQAEAILEELDHLCRVANSRTSQIRKLEQAGIPTLTALAETKLERVPRLDPAMFQRLRRQAQLQIASQGEARPRYEIVEPDPLDPRRGLALLPAPSPMDVFFDMEGYPLVEGGLEYLFGATYLEDGEPRFKDFWAFDAEGERRAFEAFVDWVMARRREDPSMHVYHYAPYETSALKRLMGTYGTREEEVDHLLRSHAFVDLYRVVNQGLRVGEPAYSLKNIEHLYMDREGEVSTAMESVVYFERWLDSGDPADWERSEPLKAIRDYNQDDCDSTWRLAEWLRARQGEAGIAYLPWADGDDEPKEDFLEGDALVRRQLAERLIRGLEGMDPDGDVYPIQEMLAHLLEFHRREDKPVWWSFFEHHDMTPDQLVDDGTSIGRARRVGKPEAIRRSTGFRYEFDPNQDTKIHEGKRVRIAGQLQGSLPVETLSEEGELSWWGPPRRSPPSPTAHRRRKHPSSCTTT